VRLLVQPADGGLGDGPIQVVQNANGGGGRGRGTRCHGGLVRIAAIEPLQGLDRCSHAIHIGTGDAEVLPGPQGEKTAVCAAAVRMGRRVESAILSFVRSQTIRNNVAGLGAHGLATNLGHICPAASQAGQMHEVERLACAEAAQIIGDALAGDIGSQCQRGFESKTV